VQLEDPENLLTLLLLLLLLLLHNAMATTIMDQKIKQKKLVCLNPLQCTKTFLHEKLFKTMFVGGSACLTIVRVGMQVVGVLALAHVLEQSKVLIHLLSSCTAAHAVATAMLLLPLLLLLMLLHLPCNYLQLHLPGSPAAAPAFHFSFLN
jgi:hypothetical protein